MCNLIINQKKGGVIYIKIINIKGCNKINNKIKSK